MRILFVAGDIGGARALAPIVIKAQARGHGVHVIRHGPIVEEIEKVSSDVLFCSSEANLENHLDQMRPDWVVFATSVSDALALNYAQCARNIGISTATILDHWSSYAARFRVSDGKYCWPDVYGVMDELAAQHANSEGVPASSLSVTGSPAFAKSTPVLRENRPLAIEKCELLFVSEPVSQDQGRDASHPNFRGYDEFQVLAVVCETLQPLAHLVNLSIFPHPRENIDQLTEHWNRRAGKLTGRIVAETEKQRILGKADRIIGMASVLLYDCWLQGYPVMSIQPNVQRQSLRYLEGRKGIVCATSIEHISDALQEFICQSPPAGYDEDRIWELERHRSADDTFLSLIENHRNFLH